MNEATHYNKQTSTKTQVLNMEKICSRSSATLLLPVPRRILIFRVSAHQRILNTLPPLCS